MAAAGFRLTEPSALIPLAVDRATLCLTMEKDRAAWAAHGYGDEYTPQIHLAMVFSRRDGAADMARSLGYNAVTFDIADGSWSDAAAIGGLMNLVHITMQMRSGGLVWMSLPHVDSSVEFEHVVCYIAFLARMRRAYVAISAPLRSQMLQVGHVMVMFVTLGLQRYVTSLGAFGGAEGAGHLETYANAPAANVTD
ncbi:unnamed protein product, partial [Prorocentrum cordatum]